MRRHLVTLALPLLVLVACSRSNGGGDGGSPGSTTGSVDSGEADAGPPDAGPCHAPAQTPTCSAPPPSLATDPLNAGFLADVHEQVRLVFPDGGPLVGWRVTFADLDGDHFPDFFTSERTYAPGHQHLFMNRPDPSGSGRIFVETTAESGILQSRLDDGGLQVGGMAVFADVDNDGDLDLFQGSYSQHPDAATMVPQSNELYLNDGTGHFTLKRDSNVNQPWPLTTTSATFVDYDKDGKLDLFVGTFMKDYPTLDAYQDLLYKGDGTGVFTEVTADAGLVQPYGTAAANERFPKATYAVTACDYDNDGWPDLLETSYALEWDDLWKNLGDGTFTNVNDPTGYSMDQQSNPTENVFRWGGNGFAAACADYDNDGDLDVFVAQTVHGDYSTTYGARNFADRSGLLVNGGAASGYTFSRPDHFTPTTDGCGTWDVAATGINRDLCGTTGPDAEDHDEGDHGATWADLDNDGLLDLIIEQSAYTISHAWIYHQKPDHTFENVTELSGSAANMGQSNGLTVDDYNRDGRLDILMGSVFVNNFQPPGGVEQVHLFENRVSNGNHWLHINLHGTTANRQGIGAKVRVTAGCLTQLREISGGKGTFGAADPAAAHFGLGKQTVVDRIEIEWPTNPTTTQVLTNVAVDQFLEITQDSDALTCQAAAQ